MKVLVEVEIPEGYYCRFCKFLSGDNDPYDPDFYCDLFSNYIAPIRFKCPECLEVTKK